MLSSSICEHQVYVNLHPKVISCFFAIASQMSALLGGDVLAGEEQNEQQNKSNQQPSFSIWRTWICLTEAV